MSGANLVADPNIILYLFGGDNFIADLLNDTQVYISFVTELELLSFTSLTPSIKQTAIKFRKEYSLKLPDAIIAATAHFLNLTLLTADKAMKKVKDIDIVLFKKE
jgi:predicted nucleic acid-binding protein